MFAWFAPQFSDSFSLCNLSRISNRCVFRIPGKVRIEGSVPPPVALACAMFWGMRKELQYQADLYEKEKQLRMAVEQHGSVRVCAMFEYDYVVIDFVHV